MQVPVVFEIGDGGLELLQLGFLARDEDVDVVRADVLVQHFAVIQLAQGIAQVVWQALLVLLVGVAFYRSTRFDFVGQTVVNTGQHRRHQQVRVGINAPKDVAVHREEIYQRIQRGEEIGSPAASENITSE